jgi:hypothetical protein
MEAFIAPALTAKHVLDLWERGLTKHPLQRSLDLLAGVYPEISLDELRKLPIGWRDLHLLAVREALFGQRLSSLTSCPQCGERLEMAFDIAQLRAIPPDSASSGPYSIARDDYEVEFHLPNSGDMLRVAELSEAGESRRTLFESCVEQARRAGVPISASELPNELVLAAAARMAELDPQADMQIELTCPACSSRWSTTFDIASYLWIEINAWALRLLHEIHCLASAYGWREADILSLSPMRRQFYLELIG